MASLVLSLMVFAMAQDCYAQGVGVAPYVGGDFGRMWLGGVGYQNPQTAQSDLWYWGGGPKGSMAFNGNLIPDPRYIWKSQNGTGYWAGWNNPYASGWYPAYGYKYPYGYGIGSYYGNYYYYPPDYLADGYVWRRLY